MSKVPTILTKHSGVIDLKSFEGSAGEGTLAVAQSVGPGGFTLPIVGSDDVFEVRRVFWITGIRDMASTRADHAHLRTSEAIFCVQGSCTVHLDDGKTKQDIRLEDPSVGIITGPNLWHTISDFSPGSVVVALADGPYDPDEYIHSYEEFLLAMQKTRRDVTGGIVQSDIDRIWSHTWREQLQSDVARVLQTRLTNDGFAVLKRHIPEGARELLEVGTGTGRFGSLIAKTFPTTTVTMSDVLPESLGVARRLSGTMGLVNVDFREADAMDLPFPPDSFDVVLSDAVIQHLPDEQRAWNEMARVVKPGGTVIISVVNRWNPHTLFKRLQGKKYHYGFERSYSHRDLAARARKAGLTVTAKDGFYPAYGVTRLARKRKWVKPIGRIFDRVARIGDRLTKRWVSRVFGFEIVIVAQKFVS